MFDLRDSSAYQLILEEGELKGEVKQVQRTLLRLGRKKFGSPDASTKATLLALGDLKDR